MIVNGKEVEKTAVFEEDGYWRWAIWTADGMVYMDGANYLSKAQAREGLMDALE